MTYLPPSGTEIDLDFSGVYTAPDGGSIVLDFSGDTTSYFVVWWNEPYSLEREEFVSSWTEPYTNAVELIVGFVEPWRTISDYLITSWEEPYKNALLVSWAEPYAPITELLAYWREYYFAAPELIRSWREPILYAEEFRESCICVYGDSLIVRMSGLQFYGNLSANRNTLLQPLGDAPVLRTSLTGFYGISAGLLNVLVHPYGNLDKVMAKFDQFYRDTLRQSVAVDQYYRINSPVLSADTHVYTLTDQYFTGIHTQPFDLAELNRYISPLAQIYVSYSGASQTDHSAVVTVNGLPITSMTSVSVEASRNQYVISGTVVLSDYSEWDRCEELNDFVLDYAPDEYIFVIESKARTRSYDKSSYTLEVVSPAIKLDIPYASLITREYDANMASVIAADLVSLAGLSISWEIIDWLIPANTLYASAESPLAILLKLVGAVGGILQSLPNGTLVACYPYKEYLDDLPTMSVDHYYTDTDNIVTVVERNDVRPGYNSYLVSDGLFSEKTFKLIQHDDTPISRFIHAFIVPWVETGVTLETSGGSWVIIEPLGIVTEELSEEVEFVDGSGTTSFPIYAVSSRIWRERPLGFVQHGEDGSLVSDVAGESLALITYTTKYFKWRVIDHNIESVQFILRVEDI